MESKPENWVCELSELCCIYFCLSVNLIHTIYTKRKHAGCKGNLWAKIFLANLRQICNGIARKNIILANLRGKYFLANLREIYDGSYSVLANPSQICDETFLSQICKGFVRILYVYLVSSQLPCKFAIDLQRTCMVCTFYHFSPKIK